ncbi:MAG: hypothetical protein AMS27_01550 [Bacteroides sp. SM23_62_1]|nr:MAG: hypothetical protein AMS27_01550 [Bacteroides sp. SM23_62_1]
MHILQCNMYSRLTYIIFILLLNICSLNGQQYGFRNFSLEDGLPQTEVNATIHDSRGNIWVGTNGGGLSRFNGKSFQTFTTQDGLGNNQLWALFEDSDSNLWIGASHCVTQYNGLSFRNYFEEPVPFLRSYIFFHEDIHGDIWVISNDEPSGTRLLKIENDSLVEVTNRFPELTNNNNLFFGFLNTPDSLYLGTRNGLYCLSDNSITYSSINNNSQLEGNFILPLFYCGEGYIWFRAVSSVTQQTLYAYKNGNLIQFETKEDPWWNGVNNMYRDHTRRIWFSNPGEGIAMFDQATGEITYFEQSNGLPNDFILNFMEDHEGNIWMGTQGGGLIQYSKNNFIAYNFESIINGDVVRAIFQDSNGDYWFGLSSAGIVKYDGSRFTPFSQDRYPGLVNVRHFIEIERNRLLILTLNGLFLSDGKNITSVSHNFGFDTPFQFSYALKDDSTLWLATLGNGVFKINSGNREQLTILNGTLQSNQVHSLYKDTRGRVWFSTNNGATVYENGTTKSYTTEDGLNNTIILQITEDFTGRFWMATFAGGINILDDKSIWHLTTSEGLTSNIIYSILTDHSGNIWAGTQNGVDRISFDSTGNIASIQHFGTSDGFTGIENNGAANYIDQEGSLWFGTVKGAMKYDPRNVEPNIVQPIIHITNIKLFYQQIQWRNDDYSKFHSGVQEWFPLPENLVLPHDSNHFTFDFEALSYQAPEKVRYQWKLDGLDKEWSPVSNRTEAVYPKIPPGEYTFMVRAMNNDGIWNVQPAEFTFRIKRAWWNSIWFISMLVIIFLGITYSIFRIRIRMVEQKKHELEELVRDKTSEVVKKNKQLEQQKEEIMVQAENLQEAYQNLERLSEIGRIITSQLTVENIVSSVYQAINNLMDATVFGIGIVNEKNHSLDFPGVIEKTETLDFLSFSLDDQLRLSVYCVKNKKEIFINDFEQEYKNYLPSITPPGKSGNSSSIIYLPLIQDKKVIGVITVQSFEKNVYTDYHLNILRNLAVYTKIALENSTAYKKIQEQTENLKIANENINKQKLEIEKVNKELVDLNQEKNHLIEIVAHDLRNPLTSSLSIANNLKTTASNLNEDERDNIKFLVGALERMNQMISRILDIRMIEQKKVNLNCEKMDFGQVLQEVYSNFEEAARQKNIKLHLQHKNLFGIADRNYLIQIFENLLSNAIKFSPKDRNVWINMEEQDGEIRINFKDEGPGVSEEDFNKLFKQFQRLTAQPTAGEKSTGLGLSIVKKFVDIMGGRVWCESEYGKGANFIVTFQKIDRSG